MASESRPSRSLSHRSVLIWSASTIRNSPSSRDEEGGPANPNSEYAENLTDAERDAYYQDLYGDEPEFDETLSDEELEEFWTTFEPTGCQAEAQKALFDREGLGEFYTEFGTQLDDIYERAQSDPRIVGAQQGLTDCLAEKGHTFEPTKDVQQQVYEQFEGRMEPLYREMESGYEDPFAGLDPESMTEEEINEILDALPPGGPELSEETLSMLAELQTEEIDLATDVWECQPNFMNSPPGGALYFEVLAEYEQKFLDENAAALGQYAGIGADS